MSIQAVSSVKNNGYVNFEGRKKENPQLVTQSVASPLKAVPLAVLIALSPLNTTRAEQILDRNEIATELVETQQDVKTKTLETKEFKTNQGNLVLELVNLKNDMFDRNVLYFNLNNGEMQGRYSGRGEMDYRLYDDSGEIFAVISLNELHFEDYNRNNLYLEDENIENYIKSLEKSKKIASSSNYTGFDNYNYSTETGYVSNWYLKAKREPEKFGSQYRPASYSTSIGNYEIHLYDNEKVLTLKREDGPELKIKSLELANDDFILRDKQSVPIKYGKIIVEYKGKEHFLVDDELFVFIANVIMSDPLSKTILPSLKESKAQIQFEVP